MLGSFLVCLLELFPLSGHLLEVGTFFCMCTYRSHSAQLQSAQPKLVQGCGGACYCDMKDAYVLCTSACSCVSQGTFSRCCNCLYFAQWSVNVCAFALSFYLAISVNRQEGRSHSSARCGNNTSKTAVLAVYSPCRDLEFIVSPHCLYGTHLSCVYCRMKGCVVVWDEVIALKNIHWACTCLCKSFTGCLVLLSRDWCRARRGGIDIAGKSRLFAFHIF